uniref:Uncharacterized exonuclease domain-containing protein At3g15140 isoform X2 n=1 Tax=Elaeis guineensis var. tenera TaxID=51953 RepID=A0A6I9Q7Z1_ELAGV|nr:uncharacterized exonuclease domain-containing protein At3g15140 isoform X2 [Elaeis guineensis]
MAFARAFVPFPPSSSSRPSLLFLTISHLSVPFQSIRNLTVSASSSALNSSASMEMEAPKTHRWRPMCLYYTQGRCIKMDDATHLEKFNHNYSADLKVNATCLNRLRPQDLDYLLVLDLEGKVEILEFPVLMIDAKTMEFIDAFHRIWHDTAIPFKDVLQEFEVWMTNHHLWEKDQGGSLHRAAFVTCGNWDLKTMIPKQCKISKIKMPLYFMEWINLKDIYLNFYKRTATGMMTMMRQLEIPVWGSHHLGIDDAKNIARVLQHMLADGVVLQITARRSTASPDEVNFFSVIESDDAWQGFELMTSMMEAQESHTWTLRENKFRRSDRNSAVVGLVLGPLIYCCQSHVMNSSPRRLRNPVLLAPVAASTCTFATEHKELDAGIGRVI